MIPSSNVPRIARSGLGAEIGFLGFQHTPVSTVHVSPVETISDPVSPTPVQLPSQTPTKGTVPVKSKSSGIAVLALLLFGALAFGQNDNMLYVRNFQGLDVGQKTTAAMASCGTNTAVPCFLVIDSSLAAMRPGTLPTMCGHCFLIDYRHGLPWISGIETALTCPFVTDDPYDAKFDGSTDDSAPIQAAMDANSCIQFPSSTPDNLMVAKVASPLVQRMTSTLEIRANGSEIDFTGTGHLFSGVSTNVVRLSLQNLVVSLIGATAPVDEIDLSHIEILNLDDYSDADDGPAGYKSLNISDRENSSSLVLHASSSFLYNVSLLNNAQGLYSFENSQLANLTTINVEKASFSSVQISNGETDGNLDLTGTGSATFNSTSIQGKLTLPVIVNGAVEYGSLELSGVQSGHLCRARASGGGYCFTFGPVIPGVTYSATGTPLPACTDELVGSSAVVTDATNLTGPYVSAGSWLAPVFCLSDGSTSQWSMLGTSITAGGAIISSVSFDSCTLADDGGEGAGCIGTESWPSPITGTYHWWCSTGPSPATSFMSEKGRWTVNRISETGSDFTYIVDNMQSDGIGSTIPMTCWATN